MSVQGARARVRIVPNREPSVWVRREPGDLANAAVGEVGPDGWAPVLMGCEISVDAAGVHIDLSVTGELDEHDQDDVTGCFPIEQVMGEHVVVEAPPDNLRGPTGTWPVPRPDAEPSKPASEKPASAAHSPDASGPHAPPPPPRAGLARAWQETSPPRKVLAILLPFALIFSVIAVARRAREPAAIASVAKVSAPAAKAAPPPASSQVPSPPAPPVPIAEPPASSAAAGAPPSKMPTKKTLERTAVDAVAAGSYPEALAHYEELSRRSPDVASYRQAVRILKLKIAGSSPRP